MTVCLVSRLRVAPKMLFLTVFSLIAAANVALGYVAWRFLRPRFIPSLAPSKSDAA
jgi:hypothetical protein